MRISIRSLLFMALLVYPITTYAQDERASVQGRVSTLWGEPIREAEVAFYQLEGIRGISPTEKLMQKATTDEQGLYKISGLPWGQYRVNVSLSGFGYTEVWRFYLWRGANRVLDIGVPIGYTHSLEPIVVSGLVQQADKVAVEAATVTLINAFDSRESQQLRTDKAGRFRFELIQPGQYIVYAAKPGFLMNATTVDLGNGSREELNLVLKRGQSKYVKTR
jgi:uncharacterized surface anchored protein